MEKIGEEPEEHFSRDEGQYLGSELRESQTYSDKEEPSQAGEVDDMLQKIKVLFSYYASYGDRLNVSNLKSTKFHKIMQDADVEANIEHRKRLDLIFCSQNKHKPNMNFDTFLDSLPLIAELKYPAQATEMGTGKALQQLLQNNILPLYEKLAVTQKQLPTQERLDVPVTETAAFIIQSIEDTLYDIYATYFPWEQVTADAPIKWPTVQLKQLSSS